VARITPPAPEGGRELAYAESTAEQAGIAAATDVTGCSITFQVRARPVYVYGDIDFITSSAAVAGNAIIADAANTVKANRFFQVTSAQNFGLPGRAVERITTPGTYTRKLRITKYSGGTVSVQVGSPTTSRSHIIAVER
jgi:hypothetical protein